VTVVKDRENWTAPGTSQIVDIVTVPSWKKIIIHYITKLILIYMVLDLITDAKRVQAHGCSKHFLEGLSSSKSTVINCNNCIFLVLGKDDSPYYTYLGAAPNLHSLRNLLEDR